MTPTESKRPAADTVSFRLANSGLFKVIVFWVGGALAFVAPILFVLLTDEYADISGSTGVWLGVLGCITAVIYMGVIAGWMNSVMKRALLEVDAWATAIGLERTGVTTLSKGFRIDPLSRSGRHRVMAGWCGTYRGQQVEVLHYFVNSGTSKNPEITRNTIVAVTSARPTSHYVEVLPQRGLEDMLVRAGAQDIEIGVDDFDRAWRLRADDEQAARAVVTPSVALILARHADIGMRVAWDQSAVVGVTHKHDVRTSALARRLDLVVEVAAATPGYSQPSTPADMPLAPTAELASSAASSPRAAHNARPVAGRRGATGGTEWIVMLVGLGLLLGGASVWNRLEQPVLGGILALIGFVLVMRPSPFVGVINRIRRRN